VTDGNLDAHLRKLSAAGYLHSRMVVKDRPQTMYSFSPSGKRAFAAYVLGLRAIIDHAMKFQGFPKQARLPRAPNGPH
jgi:DNA-binding MarR family transcriptional regulator